MCDGLDKNLHPLLTKRLLQEYLDSRNKNTKTQLIFTTHNVLLMDHPYIRKDEIWVTEKDADGKTKMQAISEYKNITANENTRDL
ncbi:MAG: ATP-binding protein [Planctomycetaceae bacterium]|jgi:AAA15 family ATPase/GTPase|nr:ATP-binding protein [Planctomycetaceae bacterium]